MADDNDIQVTTQLLHTILRPARERDVARIKALAPVSRLARALHEYQSVEPVDPTANGARRALQARHAEREVVADDVGLPAPAVDTHPLLAPATAAALNQLHALEGGLMVRAMIEAAKADGVIDPEERRRILTCLVDADVGQADRRALVAALDQPADMDGLVASVDDPELAVEVYAASLLAIRDDKPSEQRYLAHLADRLNLAPATVIALHARFGDPPPLTAEP